jgi:death-on-curing protein
MKYLTIEEATFFNLLLIEEHGGKEQAGIKDITVLESAIERPKQTIFGKDAYQTIFEKAAALMESLAKNHPFHNANKRTAFLSMVTFLSINGYEFEMDQHEAENFVVDVVLNQYTLKEVTEIIKKHTNKV